MDLEVNEKIDSKNSINFSFGIWLFELKKTFTQNLQKIFIFDFELNFDWFKCISETKFICTQIEKKTEKIFVWRKKSSNNGLKLKT